ncbi:MAG: sigma-54-dependent Fis family transcriptional regulator [Deltaproteobacteria bacterium]|nr:sigma-54-dependent Fis family transcriptional regulator [Deltaproteobacteria bacterium]
MTTRAQVLLADDEPNLRRVLTAQLERDGYDVFPVADGRQAVEAFDEHHFDLVISDLRMPGLGGMAVLAHVREQASPPPVILITAHGTVDNAVEALKQGAFDYVTKPFDRTELRNVVAKAVRAGSLAKSSASATSSEHGRHGIIGRSKAIQEVFDILDKVADTPSTVLITGESGTGKELVARALHAGSGRKEQPFIAVNCAAIPAALLESELFGYEKGAFTGAATTKPGRFELADKGTLFLDEIAEIPVSMQVKLLRALQEQKFDRVGGVSTLEVDVRVVAATNRDLRAEIAEGRFREDLYYRLNVVQVRLPALHERVEDLPLLLNHFVQYHAERLGREIVGFTDAALELLRPYAWPGNIRELENVVERCMLFCDGDRIDVTHLPPELREASAQKLAQASNVDVQAERVTAAADDGAGLKEAVREATSRLERELIVRALEKTGGNVTHAARLLKISRKSLQTKMKELGLRDA